MDNVAQDFMIVECKCPNCGYGWSTTLDRGAKTVNCPDCGTPLSVIENKAETEDSDG